MPTAQAYGPLHTHSWQESVKHACGTACSLFPRNANTRLRKLTSLIEIGAGTLASGPAAKPATTSTFFGAGRVKPMSSTILDLQLIQPFDVRSRVTPSVFTAVSNAVTCVQQTSHAGFKLAQAYTLDP